jgi:hypothetical protein
VNGDHTDSRIENLVPAHAGCHMMYHTTRQHVTGTGLASPEARAKMSNAGDKNPMYIDGRRTCCPFCGHRCGSGGNAARHLRRHHSEHAL